MDALKCLADFHTVSGKIVEYLSKISTVDIDFARIVRAWDQGGLLEFEFNYGDLTRHWLNVVAHQAATGVLAHTLSAMIEEEDQLVKEIVTATLVHDAFKRREQVANQRAKREGRDMEDSGHEVESANESFLLELGFNETVVNLARNTGDLGLRTILEGKSTLAQEIVFYADCCVSNYDIVGYKKRFDDLLPHYQPGGRYDHANEVFMKRYGKTHREVYDSVVLPIERKFAQLMRCGESERIYTLAL